MSVTELLIRAGVTRVLMVDDDLREGPTLAEVNACAPSAQGNIEAILQDPDHDATERLVEVLQQENRPHATLADLFQGLAEKRIREQCPEDLSKPYDNAQKDLDGFKAPLLKIQSWVRGKGKIELTPWPEIRELGADQFYDLLLVDYYLMENESGPTRTFIKKMIDHHRDCEQPLLVILMSTNKDGVKNDLSIIRDEVGASASRFRMLVKPSSAHAEPEPVVKEKWMQALTQLANERKLIHPIEKFIHAWEQGLLNATTSIVKRLYELDASAFAILSATAKADSMSIEEYMADVLAKRVSAETEEHSEVLNHTISLQQALTDSAASVNPTINQGVEIKDAQHAIRRLMSDVVWHRTPWHQPNAELPEKGVAPVDVERPKAEAAQAPAAANDAQHPVTADPSEDTEAPMPMARAQQHGLALAEEIEGEPEAIAEAILPIERLTGVTQSRLAWMKRNLRFGTVLREKHGLKRYYVNITQACDVQNVKFEAAADYHYLFVRGEKLAVDRVAKGEKVFESPYYAQSSDVDDFYSFHWNLRQPFTPSMTDVLDHLEEYSIEGQLRNESAYAVLAKFLSQASRVALLRMPKIYRCPVYTLHREKDTWQPYTLDGDSEVYASCWEKKSGTWCSQFQMDDAYRIVSTRNGMTADIQAKSVAALGKSTQFDASKGQAKNLAGTPIYLVRLNSDADLDIVAVIRQFASDANLKEAKEGDVVVVIRTANSFV
ncbi:hypothetical protein QVM48_25360 [Pseudomonas soli]|jgi:hypothetical protein|uniref:hypothetical protein n=1 Tax=Pseudomonas soli TaxID=1306993 RepID=UPI002893A155|nr:hypothetical protein [Pseudomonas soli]MDT3712728.1 hypothetical protein [Pseudomonas soli]MDT3730065.1 hypothetical protein [Pseudomonas soli]